ncbi:ABC transporter substrate-binding protein [Microbacterium sp. RD1]|uniref:ABC transporter substrate-binding protein n=1 Tax=Microbacterium sp. RD1 TaxID=3457313 RepID=UPI003FA579AA
MHRTIRPRTTVTAALAIVFATALTACSTTPASDTSSSTPATGSGTDAAALLPDDVKERGYITVVTDLTYPPFGLLDEDGTTPIGIDIDTAAALEEVLGVEVRVENISFDAFIPGLSANRYDAGFNAISDLPERREVVDFIDFNHYGGLFLTPPDTEIEVSEAIDVCGYTVGASKGSDTVIYLEDLQKECEEAGREPVEISVYGNQADALVAMESGRVDAVLGGSTAGYLAENSGGAYVVNGPLLPPFDIGGMALPKDSPLTPALLAGITELYENGTLAEIYAQYGIAEDFLIEPVVNGG